jgi:hypothetical protein
MELNDEMHDNVVKHSSNVRTVRVSSSETSSLQEGFNRGVFQPSQIGQFNNVADVDSNCETLKALMSRVKFLIEGDTGDKLTDVAWFGQYEHTGMDPTMQSHLPTMTIHASNEQLESNTRNLYVFIVPLDGREGNWIHMLPEHPRHHDAMIPSCYPEAVDCHTNRRSNNASWVRTVPARDGLFVYFRTGTGLLMPMSMYCSRRIRTNVKGNRMAVFHLEASRKSRRVSHVALSKMQLVDNVRYFEGAVGGDRDFVVGETEEFPKDHKTIGSNDVRYLNRNKLHFVDKIVV